MLGLATGKLNLGLYIEALQGLSASMKLGLLGTVAHRNLSFIRFEDQRKKFLVCVFETRPTNVGNFHLQNGNKTWVRLGALYLQSRDSGMSSRADGKCLLQQELH